MDNQLEQQIEKILPEDIARTFESAYHVLFQGNYEHVDDLLRNGGTLIKKAAQRFTPTQIILGIAALASVAVVIVARAADNEDGQASNAGPRPGRIPQALNAGKKPEPTPQAS